MNSFTVFLLVLVVLGALAKPQTNNFRSNDFNGIFSSPLPVLNTHTQTSVVENPTIEFPSLMPPTTISETCHCLNTLVRPQLYNEIITVPTVDPIIRTVSTPIVETAINCNGGTRLGKFANANNLLSAVVNSKSLSGALQNSDGNTNILFNEINRGGFIMNQKSSGANTNGVSIGLISRPLFSIQGNTRKNSFTGTSNGEQINNFPVRK